MRTLLRLAIVVSLVGVVGCDGCDSLSGDQPRRDDPLDKPDNPGDEGEGEPAEGEGEEQPIYTLLIEPVNPILEATVGGSETLQLTAILVDEQGVRTPAPDAFWASLAPQVGSVDQTGLFTPSRERAGECLVRARAQGVEGTTIVRVHLHDAQSTGGSSNPGDFDGAVGAGAIDLLYPFDGVVIPANLAPMVAQWNKQKPRARMLLTGAYGSLAVYTDGNEVQASADAWRRFLLAHVGASFTMTIEESDGPGSERVQRTITINLAAADLTSTVYYWAVDRGQIVRIDADSLQPIDMTIPAQGSDNGCRACHSLSANGQRMSFTYFGGNEPGGVIDTNGSPVILDDPSRRWNFSALSPDGSLLLTAFANRLTLRDGLTGNAIPGFEDLGFNASHPTFSPTGTQIAFPANTLSGGSTPAWEIDFTTSDLFVADVDPVARTVSNPRQLVPSNGRALYFPSFNPDGSLVAYTDGTSSRSTTPGDIYLARASDTSGDAPRVKLTNANPVSQAYAPTFNPKVEGGYQWIAFYSRRGYGHHTPAGRPQIWVAAVDANADPASGIDPSHPPFWLPGQSESSENLSSFFAPKPCEQTGGLCDTDAACCGDGLCRPVNGVSQCVPPENACTLTGDPCGSDDQCCDGLNCVVNPESGQQECLPPGEVCSQEGQVCQLDADCCAGAGLCVDDGTGTTRCQNATCAQDGESCNGARACCSTLSICTANGVCVNTGG